MHAGKTCGFNFPQNNRVKHPQTTRVRGFFVDTLWERGHLARPCRRDACAPSTKNPATQTTHASLTILACNWNGKMNGDNH
jgi:hypothetical protein